MSRGSTAFHNGMAAEEIAARKYEANGGQVLARRWKVSGGEVDLIIRLNEVIVFVEVKARPTLEAAMAAVLPKQQVRLLSSAEQYLAAHANLGVECRFDLAAVDKTGACEIVENAFLF